MSGSAIRWFVVFGACLFTGCGSGGVQPGVPADTTAAPVNPTPDMGPDPKPGGAANQPAPAKP